MAKISANDRQSSIAPDLPDCAAIWAEMNASRQAFHALLNAVPPEDWRRKSLATAFTVAELFEHIVHGLELIPVAAVGLAGQLLARRGLTP